MNQYEDYSHFLVCQIKKLTTENGKEKYVKNLDRVIEDIFGYRRLITKIRSSSYLPEVIYVFSDFGWENCRIFQVLEYYDVLRDMVYTDSMIRKLSTKINKKKASKKDKAMYNKAQKSYWKAVKKFRTIFNTKSGKQNEKRKTDALNAFIKKPKDSIWSIFDADDEFSEYQWGGTGSGETEDYYDVWRKGKAQEDPPMQAESDIAEDDDGDDPGIDDLEKFINSNFPNLREYVNAEDDSTNEAMGQLVDRMNDMTDRLDQLINVLATTHDRSEVSTKKSAKPKPRRPRGQSAYDAALNSLLEISINANAEEAKEDPDTVKATSGAELIQQATNEAKNAAKDEKKETKETPEK